MKRVKTMLAAVSAALLIWGCEKDEHIPPDMSLKTGGIYTASDATVGKFTPVTVGVLVEKTEDELKTFNISHAFDGAATTTSDTTFTLSGDEEEHFDIDHSFMTRNQAGTEKYIFTVTDRDGNIAQKQVVLTVQ